MVRATLFGLGRQWALAMASIFAMLSYLNVFLTLYVSVNVHVDYPMAMMAIVNVHHVDNAVKIDANDVAANDDDDDDDDVDVVDFDDDDDDDSDSDDRNRHHLHDRRDLLLLLLLLCVDNYVDVNLSDALLNGSD